MRSLLARLALWGSCLAPLCVLACGSDAAQEEAMASPTPGDFPAMSGGQPAAVAPAPAMADPTPAMGEANAPGAAPGNGEEQAVSTLAPAPSGAQVGSGPAAGSGGMSGVELASAEAGGSGMSTEPVLKLGEEWLAISSSRPRPASLRVAAARGNP